MAVLTGKALDDAIRQKAQQGQGVTDKNNQAAYDAYRATIDKEIERKVGTGDALTGNSAYNQSMYDKLMAAKNKSTGEVTTSSVPSSNTGNAQSLIDQLNAARLNNTIAALGKSRDAALSNLSSEKSAIQPKYYDQRNQVAAGAQQQARNFAEYMAARGGTSSGANAQAELSRNMTTQGNLGTLGRQEAQAYTDIERRTSDLNNAYESDVAGATAGIEADKMQAMLNDYYANRDYQTKLGELMGTFQGQKTLAGQQFDYSKYADQRDYNYQKDLNTRDFNYQVGRDDVADSQWAQQFAEAVKQNGIQNAMAQVKASSGGSGGSGTKGLSLAQKISIWKISGQAPEGIPGVTPGTKVYDEVAARNAAEKSGGVKLWDAIKGVIGSISKSASNAGTSDSQMDQYLNTPSR